MLKRELVRRLTSVGFRCARFAAAKVRRTAGDSKRFRRFSLRNPRIAAPVKPRMGAIYRERTHRNMSYMQQATGQEAVRPIERHHESIDSKAAPEKARNLCGNNPNLSPIVDEPCEKTSVNAAIHDGGDGRFHLDGFFIAPYRLFGVRPL